jgi:hypothetical protein
MAASLSPKRNRQRGSEIVEFGFICLPLFGFLFLIIDLSWMIFAQVTLQSAVRQGVRYAVTGQTLSGMGQDASIRAVVTNAASGFLSADTAKPGESSMIDIEYYLPNTLANAGTGVGSNAGGNIVEISINGFSLSPLGPVLKSAAAISIAARASDIVEPSPGGGPPAR